MYCASHHGRRPGHTLAARELGAAIADRGWSLVYGGGQIGLMGEVADTALARGAHVTGVITEHLLGLEVGHSAVTELVVVSDMAERKREMFARADAFCVLPGGIGTLEELFEVWCWSSLGLHRKPLVILNADGYFTPMLSFLQRALDDGLLRAEALEAAAVVASANEAIAVINGALERSGAETR